eukprot:g13174.t1
MSSAIVTVNWGTGELSNGQFLPADVMYPLPRPVAQMSYREMDRIRKNRRDWVRMGRPGASAMNGGGNNYANPATNHPYFFRTAAGTFDAAGPVSDPAANETPTEYGSDDEE